MLLGVDPAGLARLRRSMREVARALTAIRSDDPLAIDAVRLAHRWGNELEHEWLPIIDRALRIDHALESVDAWSLDADDLAELAAVLESVAGDTHAAREFVTGFDSWAELSTALGERRLIVDSGQSTWPPVTVAQIDALLAALAHVQRTVLAAAATCPAPPAFLPELDEMSPYAAALLVRELDLDGFTLAAVTARLLERWLTSGPVDSGDPLPEWSLPGDNPADLLFALLADDPGAAAAFVRFAATRPAILFETSADEDLAARVAVAGTNPSVLGVAEAEGVLTAVIEYASVYALTHRPSNDTYQPVMAVVIADLVAPWTLQFSPLDTSWQASAERRSELLAMALDDAGAIDRLVAHADAVTASVVRGLGGTGATDRLEVFVAYLSMLTDLVVRARVTSEEQALARWEMLWAVAGAAANVAAPTTGSGVALDVALVGAQGVAGNWAPDPEAVAADAERARTLTLTVAAAAVAARVYDQWVDDGLVTSSLPPPPAPDQHSEHPAVDFLREFRAWRAQLPGGDDGALASQVTALVYTVVNPEQAGTDASR